MSKDIFEDQRLRTRTLKRFAGNENDIRAPSGTLCPGPPPAPLQQMGKLTTHVLDTASGIPAAGVRIRLFCAGELLSEQLTNADGRCGKPLLTHAEPAEYELLFSIGDYFRTRGVSSPFLNDVPILFTVESGRDYHVPLACSPYSYSTYRGS